MSRRKFLSILLCAGVVLSVILSVWTMWGNTALMVSEISIASERLPASFSQFRVALVSDLHNTEFGEGNVTLLQMLSESSPDIIVITGDLVDARHTNVEVACGFAENASKIAPIYFVSGNHEASSGQYEALKDRLEAMGVTVLEDDMICLNREDESIALLGLADPNFMTRGDLFNQVPTMISTKINNMLEQENVYSVLLSHRPELFETYAVCGVDLVLSGHAHGGQFRLPFIGGLIAPDQGLFPRYDAGLFTDGNTNMIVSRGLGNSIIPIRFNNRPEIVLIELHSTNN